jgi:hypothetical protein
VENWQATEIYQLHQTPAGWEEMVRGKTAIAGFVPVSAESLLKEEHQLLRILDFLGWKEQAAILNLSQFDFALSDLNKMPQISRLLLFGTPTDFPSPALKLPVFKCVQFKHIKMVRSCSLFELSENKNQEKRLIQPALEALKF